MKVLLKDGADQATAASILILPPEIETTLVTLSGEGFSRGLVAEVEYSVVAHAINAAVMDHAARASTSRKMLKAVEWMTRALDPYEIGSKVGLHFVGSGCYLDFSKARAINRAWGLSDGDMIVIGPAILSKELINARGRVVSHNGQSAVVELEPGDRDRMKRATGMEPAKHMVFSLDCVEKVEASLDTGAGPSRSYGRRHLPSLARLRRARGR